LEPNRGEIFPQASGQGKIWSIQTMRLSARWRAGAIIPERKPHAQGRQHAMTDLSAAINKIFKEQSSIFCEKFSGRDEFPNFGVFRFWITIWD
jgi:hypothetical protein